MSLRIITKGEVLSFLSQLMKRWEVVGVTKKAMGNYANEAKLHGGIQSLQSLKGTPAAKYEFEKLGAASEACLDYTVTVLPPKKYFMPAHETPQCFSQVFLQRLCRFSEKTIIYYHLGLLEK